MGCNSIKANHKYRYCRELLVSSNNSVASTNRKVFNRNGSTLFVLLLTIPKPSILGGPSFMLHLRNNCVARVLFRLKYPQLKREERCRLPTGHRSNRRIAAAHADTSAGSTWRPHRYRGAYRQESDTPGRAYASAIDVPVP